MADIRRGWPALIPLAGALFVALLPPADATEVIGHRCRSNYPADRTNENTVKSLREVDAIRNGGITVRCEVDTWPLKGAGGEATGPLITWHDETWTRVAESTEGLPDRVPDTTAAQAATVRTKGGQRAPSIRRMIEASGTRDVPLVVEWKWDLSGRAESLVAYARRKHARVWWYGILGAHNCGWHNVDAFAAAGARVGIKSHHCAPEPREARRHGVDFVSLRWPYLTKAKVRAWTRRGIDVMSGGVPVDQLGKARRWGVSAVVYANPGKGVRAVRRQS